MKNFDLLDINYFNEDKLGKTPAYYFNKTKHILDNNLIEELKLISSVERKTMRICLHNTIDDNLHNMIIIDYKNNPNLPHFHISTSESHHIIEGKLGCFIFDQDGKIIRKYILSKDHNILDRLNNNECHLLLPISDYVIFHETNKGSFNRHDPDMHIPKWFSKMTEKEKNYFYLDMINKF